MDDLYATLQGPPWQTGYFRFAITDLSYELDFYYTSDLSLPKFVKLINNNHFVMVDPVLVAYWCLLYNTILNTILALTQYYQYICELNELLTLLKKSLTNF